MTRLPRILVITDRTQVRTSVEHVVRDVCGKTGCGWVLLRDKDMERAARRVLALKLREITRECGARFSVSTDVGLAAECEADGVHLQQAGDLAAARFTFGAGWIGISAHSLDDVRAAKDAGADYATLSPIFPTESKPGYGPQLGLETIREAAGIGIPIYALGGITPASAYPCLEAGAHGFAVMGTVMRAERPGDVIREYARAFSTSSYRVE